MQFAEQHECVPGNTNQSDTVIKSKTSTPPVGFDVRVPVPCSPSIVGTYRAAAAGTQQAHV